MRVETFSDIRLQGPGKDSRKKMAAFGGPIPRGAGRSATLGKVLIFVSKNSQGLITRSENSTYSVHIHKPTSLWAFPLKEQQHHSKPQTQAPPSPTGSRLGLLMQLSTFLHAPLARQLSPDGGLWLLFN